MNTNEEQTQDKKLSCAYCAVTNCNAMDKTYPSFCLTTNMDESFKEETMETYDEGDNLKVMQTAAQVEHEGYMKWCRKSSGLQRGWVIKNLALQAVWG